MTQSYHLIPGILEKSFSAIEEKIARVTSLTNKVHIDVVDGIFADNQTWMDPRPFKKYSEVLDLEVHLMVDNPVQYIASFAENGFKKFIGHIERMPDITNFISTAEQYGQVGLALDTHTLVTDLRDVSWEDLDFAFIMTVKAGYSNQEFLPAMLEKVRQIREEAFWLTIEVDGGINTSTIVQAQHAGATEFVATHALFDDNDIVSSYKKLTELLSV